MCKGIEAISKTSKGELNFCRNCQQFHLEFNNIYFEFTPIEYKQFRKYVLLIESEFWERKYANANVRRKIPIPTLQENLVLMFNRQEVAELKALISNKKEAVFNSILNVDDIDYTFIIN